MPPHSLPPATETPARQHGSLSPRGPLLLLTAAGWLLVCQIPMLLWLLPGLSMTRHLQQHFPLLRETLDRLVLLPWLPVLFAAVLSGMAILRIRRQIVLPLWQIRQQVLLLCDNPHAILDSTGGTEEIEAVAQACESLRIQLVERANQNLKLAYEDPLTGLDNRLRFVTATDQRLQTSLRRLLVIAWSLDRFNSLNNILGFAAGDHLIKAVAIRLRDQLRGAVSIARLSSHTFACAFELDEEECPEARIRQIQDTLTAPVRIYGQPIELTAACGAAISPRDGQAAGDLTRRAEIAQSIAAQSRLRWLMFQNHFEVQSSARLNMLSELRAALQTKGQLQLFLQPKLDLATGRIEAAEALVRWQHPQRGLVMPNEFIPFAEQTGRIHDITLWAIAEALSLIDQIRNDQPVCISVNISSFDLHETGFADTVAQMIERADIPAELLCLEITESWAMDRPEQVLDTLERLHALGVRLAIDDFGSGYSSMAYMKRFPVNELKIDRSLVAGVKRLSHSETILRCITELGHHLGLTVTAEGVETLEEYASVKAMGIDSIQGYLIGKAMPLQQFRQFMQRFDSQSLLH